MRSKSTSDWISRCKIMNRAIDNVWKELIRRKNFIIFVNTFKGDRMSAYLQAAKKGLITPGELSRLIRIRR